MVNADEGRRRHYGTFYGINELPSAAPLGVVFGNCQAESLRLMLEGDGLTTVRIPPVHELTNEDMPWLHRLLGRVEVLVTQPVTENYHGLELGTAQVSDRLPAGSVIQTVPVIRFAGLYPHQVIVRAPSDPSLVPPLVPYHDLRILAEAAHPSRGFQDRPISVEQVQMISRASLAELRRREQNHDATMISDVFLAPTFGHMRTINHPGNLVFTLLAGRVRSALGLSGKAPDLKRELLNEVHAPRESAVIKAFGLPEISTPDWTVGGARVTAQEVRLAHLQWYREHPDAVSSGIDRHRATLEILGLE